jgi:hypothetical protein
VTRGARFFLLAGLIRRFGEPVRHFIERRLTMVAAAAGMAIILGFVAIRYV